MMDGLLRTKLYLPPPRPNLVARRRLIDTLNQGLLQQRRVTLLSAPAGAGKSTLLSAWAAECGRPASWVALDSGDSDPRRFLTYLIAALQTLPVSTGKTPGTETAAMLQAPQPLPLETILTALVNEIAAVPGPFLLILDDYHTLDSPQVDEALTFLLDYQPPQLHLAIGSREDPNLPLARLRARGQLTELRAADLRFTAEETAVFLNTLMQLDLTPPEIAALDARTEGWAAGLQMAALALQVTPASPTARRTFLESFAGSHRFILDYLLEEVLQQQSAEVRAFLLRTAVLEQLNGPLCDAVVGEAVAGNARRILNDLEKSNLFLVPLDAQRQWYRYHHLFAEVLQAHLHDEPDIDIPTLHRRAGRWYAEQDQLAPAIHHTLAAADFSAAAALLEAVWPEMNQSFRAAGWLQWARQLPDAVIIARPLLGAQYAWALIDVGDMDGAIGRVREVEQQNDVTTLEDPIPAMLALARAQIALVHGEFDTAVDYARRGQSLAGDDFLQRAQAAVILGVTNWSRGELEGAYAAMAGWVDSMLAIDNLYFAAASSFVLADLRVAQGRLHEAVQVYQQSLARVADQEAALRPILSHHHLGLAMLYHEMGAAEPAIQAWKKAREVGRQSVLINWPSRWHRALARRKISAGEWAAALELLDEAARQYVPNPVPDTEPIAAVQARIFLRQGRLGAAQAWARAEGVGADDPLSYMSEYAHLTLARIYLTEFKENQSAHALAAARKLLARLLPAAEAGGRAGRVIEILTLQALVEQAAGAGEAAQRPFVRALKLAQPAGYFRLLVDEGEAITPLLQEAAAARLLPDFTARLLAALGETAVPSARQPLADPLSPRELEVLRLLQTELSGPQIARELVVALSTVRSHTKQIYSKLAVSGRRAAVKRAGELGLL